MSTNAPVRVKHVMSTDFHTVDGLMSVEHALSIMKATNAKMLMVEKRDPNDEYGIVLLSDIAREVLAVDRSPAHVNIYEIMSKPVVGVDPEMDIRYCARMFNKLGFSYAPVIDKGELLGIVSYADMLLKGLSH